MSILCPDIINRAEKKALAEQLIKNTGGEKKMTVRDIYEKVNLSVPMEQRHFFNYFDDTVAELQSMYSGFVAAGDNYQPPDTLDDGSGILPLYHNAIVDNIMFLAGREEGYKSEFIRKSKAAYLKYWSDSAKGRKMRKAGR